MSAASPSYVAAERGVSMPEYDPVLTEDLPLSCEEPDVKQVPKKDKDKKDKDKHKKDKDKKDKDKHKKDKDKKKKKEEPKKKDKDSIASARSGRRPAVSARHSPKGNRLSAIPTSTNKTDTWDAEVRPFRAFEKPAIHVASASIGIASV